MATPKNAPGVPAPAGQPLPSIPDDMLEITAQDAGLGVSTDPDDQILPLITVLQTNSPITDKRSTDYIAGAEAGAFWFRGDLIPIRDGVIGFDAIPCGMLTVWNEWGPTRGSGLFGRHPKQPDDVELRANQEDGGKRPQLIRRNGNVVQQAREFYLLVDGKPYCLPFHGTGHTTAKRWQAYMAQLRHPKTNGVLPSYTHRYLLTTTSQNNALGRWFGVKFEDRGAVSLPEFQAARALHAIIAPRRLSRSKLFRQSRKRPDHEASGPTASEPGRAKSLGLPSVKGCPPPSKH